FPDLNKVWARSKNSGATHTQCQKKFQAPTASIARIRRHQCGCCGWPGGVLRRSSIGYAATALLPSPRRCTSISPRPMTMWSALSARWCRGRRPRPCLNLSSRDLDQMQAAVSDAATKGDTNAIETQLKIMRMRGRYLGLFADSKGGGVHVNVATGSGEPLKIEFVKSPYTHEPMPGPLDLGHDEYR